MQGVHLIWGLLNTGFTVVCFNYNLVHIRRKKVVLNGGFINKSNICIIQWNLDLTKSLGTGQICSLNGGLLYRKPRDNEFEGKRPKCSLYQGHSYM